MPTRQITPAGAPCWVDLQTSSTERARTFYTRLFGWQAQAPSPDFGGYFMFTREGMPIAGCMPSDVQAPIPDVWSVYLSTADAAKTLASGADHGGQIYVQPMPVADLGTMGFLLDPAGAGIGVWQPATFRGCGVLAESGAPAWFELFTHEYATSVGFYRDVFGWQTEVVSDTPQLRITAQMDPDGAGPLCGIVDGSASQPEGAPAQWRVYFAVDDADAALGTVVELGGTVLRPAEDTPNGRSATATDPIGATFGLLAPNAATHHADPN